MYVFYFYSISNIYSCQQTEDPDQTPRSVASDQGLHCLLMSKKWDARLIWVKVIESSFGLISS